MSLKDLVALGYFDQYLTREPNISFFKQIYKKHTNFVTEYNNSNINIHINYDYVENLNKIGCDICFDDDVHPVMTFCGCSTNYCKSCVNLMSNICCVCKNLLKYDSHNMIK
jgi:hypothetical protein